MAYLVLARKYRPVGFDSVSGQEHVTRTLQNAIRRGRIAHAYLFAGPRGVGKTSIARIFSKALNCKEGATPTPCLSCTNCLEITAGTSLAVREIDGASHNSVDNVRELIESFRAVPAAGSRYKVYIIDEVHMLSTAAFNALLKSLEEPPPHAVFILATTDVHKIPDTVISRCQRYDLRALGSDVVEARLREVSRQEGITAEPQALRMIARLSEGSMRDAQTLLDRVISFCDGALTAEEAGKVLGVVERRLLFRLSEAILSRDTVTAMAVVDTGFAGAIEPGLFLREFVLHWRDLLIARFGGEGALERLGIPADDAVELRRQVEAISGVDLQDLVSVARQGADDALRSYHPRYAFESLVVRMATRVPSHDLSRLIEAVEGGRAHGADPRGPAHPSASSVTPQVVSSVPRAVIPKVERPVESRDGAVTPRETPAPDGSPDGEGLDWSMFVRRVASGRAKILGEHLKRLVVETFEPGTLRAVAPSLAASYIEGKENREKLHQELVAFTGHPEWRIVVTTSGTTASKPESLLEREKRQEEEERRERHRDVAKHPVVQSLQRVFPGSKIESIRRKE